MGKDKIRSKFTALKRQNKKALISYICAGDPSLETTISLVDDLVAGGVDLVELGVPFSDPVADGPVIQKASQRALQNGTTFHKVMETAYLIKKRHPELPLILMGYYNPFLRYGLDKLVETASDCGIDAVIIPDLPFEAASELKRKLAENSLGYIPMVAPTTTEERLERILIEDEYPFVYCVSLAGVTGIRTEIPQGIAEFMSKVRMKSNSPLALGFGISNAVQAQAMGKLGDGIIVGSAFVKLIDKFAHDYDQLQTELTALVADLNRGLINI